MSVPRPLSNSAAVLLRCHLWLEEILGIAVVVVLQVGNIPLAAGAGLSVLVPGWFQVGLKCFISRCLQRVSC